MESSHVVIAIRHSHNSGGSKPIAGTVSFKRMGGEPDENTGQRCRIEKIRYEGFQAIRKFLAEIVTKRMPNGKTAFDEYQENSARTDAVGRVIAQLPRYIPGIEQPFATILDITCGTGTVSAMLIDLMTLHLGKGTEHPTLVINDIKEFTDVADDKIRQKLKHIRSEGKEIQLQTTNVDPTSQDCLDGLGRERFDLIFWTSVNIPGKRSLLLRNVFHLLRPEGWLVAIGSYPWEPIPARYVGARKYGRLAVMSRPTDMGSGLITKVEHEWAIAAQDLSLLHGHEIIKLVIHPEQFGNTALDKGNKREVRCIGFQKPGV